MLDAVSVVLGFISIIQNIKKGKNTEEKITLLQKGLEEVDGFYKVLRDSKQIHDSFEKFARVGMDPLHLLIKKGDGSSQSIREHIDSFLDYDRTFVEIPSNLIPISSDTNKLNELPVEIRSCIEKLLVVYPQVKDNINTYKENKLNLIGLHKKHNYGDDLTGCVVLLNNTVKEATSNADRTILNVAPIIDFIHYTLRITLKDF